MKPYLKGFQSLESWCGGWDTEGWKVTAQKSQDKKKKLNVGTEEEGNEDITLDPNSIGMENTKQDLLRQFLVKDDNNSRIDRPPTGLMEAVPRFKEDLEALLHLAQANKPAMRCVCNRHTVTAYYGFGDASPGGFGSTAERPNGLHGRFGIWGNDNEEQSSNYRELCNLVETVEEKAQEGHLKDSELWIFTDISTAESCFFKEGSTSKTLHELIL